MKILIQLLAVGAVCMGLTACSLGNNDTGNRSTDLQAAQSFMPTLVGYSANGVDNIQQALTTSLGGASLLSGNPVQALLIQRISSMFDCYQAVGAMDARIYTQNLGDALSGQSVPIGGVLGIINIDRVTDNFVSCLLGGPQDAFGAQSVEPEPCYGYGSFSFEGDSITYFYAATDTPLCTLFAQHFQNNYGVNPTGQDAFVP